MKKCYIICFEKKPNMIYNGLITAIKSYGTWAKLTETAWAVTSEKKSSEIRDHLKGYVTSTDKIIVIRTGDTAAWKNFSDSATAWLKKYIN